MKNSKIFIALIVGITIFINFSIVLAAPTTPSTTTPGTTSDYGLKDVKGQGGLVTKSATDVVGNIIQWAIGIVGVILVIMLIYGGVLYMTSAGNEQKVESAKKTITYAVIGITIVALAFAITRFVLDALLK